MTRLDWGAAWRPKLPKLYTYHCPKHGSYWGEKDEECPHCLTTQENDDANDPNQ